eukprot:TRINITY_DN29644_c0_g1_i1.p1 TRINITY_DN29644_c0_g1~~TRINITY_DN29644_c0_g1_i1.p1  ORF type:complete len:311 (-),score=58.95 TRINITY_DN29644_c0_g1_i1:356-1288(-)
MPAPAVVKDEHTGLEKVILKEPHGHSAEVHLHGGHVTSWKSEKNEEHLFMSSKAVFKPPKAIRGGIPICFPQFGPLGPLDQHGFARNRSWTVDPQSTNEAPQTVDLLLLPTEEDKRLWPHSFELRMRVTIGSNGALISEVSVSNVDTKPFSFTFALHTYLSVSDISEVRIEGLETLDYLDNMADRKRVTDQGDAISFDAEFDRIYLGTPPSKIAIVDHSKHKTIVLVKEGLPDAVVWNPWKEKAKSMSDFGDEDFKRMVCVEAAAVENPITLKPGEEWRARQELNVVSSSYYSGQLDRNAVLKAAGIAAQ